MEQLTVEQALLRAGAHEAEGETDQALKLYQAVLQALPQNEKASQAVARLRGTTPTAAPLQQTIDELVGLYNQGRLKDVTEKAEALTRQYPSAFVVWNILGAAAAQSSQLPLAERAFTKASELNPSAPEARNNLGNVLKEQGKFEEAVDAYKQALAINPNYVLAHNNIGVTLHEQDRFEDAAAAFRVALRLKPDYSEALNHYGVTLQKLRNLNDAVATLEKAIRIAPEYVDAQNNLGIALKEQGRFDQAIAVFDKAIQLNPDYARSQNNKGIALKEQGRQEEAIACYRKALQLDPNYPEALNNLGNALFDANRFDEAIEAFRKTLEIAPGFSEAYLNYSWAVTFREDDPLIARMAALYDEVGTESKERVDLCFALAKAHEDLENYADAFAFLKEGNSLRKKLSGYELARDQRHFASVRSADAAIRQSPLAPDDNSNSPRHVFILGMPRSGTSLVEQIVSAHSEVFGAGELSFVREHGGAIAAGQRPATAESLGAFRDKYNAEINRLAGGARVVTDKMPQNFMFIGLICKTFPDARIVHVERSAAATCWSNYRQHFASEELGYCQDLDDIVRYYGMYKDLMRYWQEQYGDRIHSLDYEALTTNQEATTRSLIDFVGLDWEDACLAPQDNKRAVNTASKQQVQKAVYSGSSQMWRRYEPYLGGAFDALENLARPSA